MTYICYSDAHYLLCTIGRLAKPLEEGNKRHRKGEMTGAEKVKGKRSKVSIDTHEIET